MFTEDDLLPISALQHLLFCRRQCALIHLEQAWSENQLTAQGRQLHDRAHDAGPESRGDVRIVRGLRLRSLALGLSGCADVVELHRTGSDTPADQQAIFPGIDGQWIVYPVEYKRGKPKASACDRVQLCAQAACLEEMLGISIPAGALYYGQLRHRQQVVFDDALRLQLRQAAAELRELIRSGVTPAAEYSGKCKSCSLVEQCMPKSAGGGRSARSYIEKQLQTLDERQDENNEKP